MLTSWSTSLMASASNLRLGVAQGDLGLAAKGVQQRRIWHCNELLRAVRLLHCSVHWGRYSMSTAFETLWFLATSQDKTYRQRAPVRPNITRHVLKCVCTDAVQTEPSCAHLQLAAGLGRLRQGHHKVGSSQLQALSRMEQQLERLWPLLQKAQVSMTQATGNARPGWMQRSATHRLHRRSGITVMVA